MRCRLIREVGMAHPMGERESGGLRLDFDRRLKLEFHQRGPAPASCARLQPRRFHAHPGVAEGGGALVADHD